MHQYTYFKSNKLPSGYTPKHLFSTQFVIRHNEALGKDIIFFSSITCNLVFNIYLFIYICFVRLFIYLTKIKKIFKLFSMCVQFFDYSQHQLAIFRQFFTTDQLIFVVQIEANAKIVD